MLGAIAGDIIGSRFELHSIRDRNFTLFHYESRFTDDTVLTVAIANALLTEQEYDDRRQHYIDQLHDWFAQYPDAGYGESFYSWADDRKRQPYGSWGNGSAMRVSPIGWAFNTLEETLAEAELSASVTHDNPGGIKGARAIAACIFLARHGKTKEEIAEYVTNTIGYDVSVPLEETRRVYRFDVSCAGSVPQAIRCFLEADDYENTVRNAVWLGGDTDTLACMGGSIAEAYYGGVPAPIALEALTLIPAPLRNVTVAFCERYNIMLPWGD